eukprot:7872473-Pyramimonas_sp.AAC.2
MASAARSPPPGGVGAADGDGGAGEPPGAMHDEVREHALLVPQVLCDHLLLRAAHPPRGAQAAPALHARRAEVRISPLDILESQPGRVYTGSGSQSQSGREYIDFLRHTKLSSN